MSQKPKKIAILTGGGDCPGLNAAICSVVQTCEVTYNTSVVGIKNGFKGLLENDTRDLTLENTQAILSKGGTILGSSNKDTPFAVPVKKNGKLTYEDHSDEAIANLKQMGAEALIVVGGDGTQTIAHKMSLKGVPVMGIPKTIDNDLEGTELTIGFFTAVNTAVQALDKIQTTAESHSRILVVEVMGRYAGWIALFAGLGGDADVILIPEIPYELHRLMPHLKNKRNKKKHSVVVVAEGAKSLGGEMTVSQVIENSPDQIRLGGIAHKVAHELEALTGQESRAIVLGHLLRGGSPDAFDRVLATRFGAQAVKAIHENNFGHMVAYKKDRITLVPISQGAGKNRFVKPDSSFLQAAKLRGILFGDS